MNAGNVRQKHPGIRGGLAKLSVTDQGEQDEEGSFDSLQPPNISGALPCSAIVSQVRLFPWDFFHLG